MSYNVPSQEKRPLKKPKIGPPDVYPQEAKQKEDELTAERLKTGYANSPACASLNEHQTARISVEVETIANKINNSLASIADKKKESRLNALPDSTKRRVIRNDHSFSLASASPKTREAAEKWWRGLAGNEPLSELVSKKVPIFNKKEGASEIFIKLCDSNVPMSRATWYIKMTAVYFMQQQENVGKMRRKQNNMSEPSIEWTELLTTFLSDVLRRLTSYYCSAGDTNAMNPEQEVALKRWQYCTRLAHYMDQDDLLERQNYLLWIQKLFVKQCRQSDEGLWSLLIPFFIQNLTSFMQSEVMCRRIAYASAHKLAELYHSSASHELGCPSPSTPNPISTISGSPYFVEYMNCTFHRNIVLCLCTYLQYILIECPTALVWNYIKPEQLECNELLLNPLGGSALDFLPCGGPSTLPLPSSKHQAHSRKFLKDLEDDLKDRSLAAELQWSTDDTSAQSGTATIVSQLLEALNCLDKHKPDEVSEDNCVDSLYHKIFPGCIEDLEIKDEEKCCIKMLCRWAITAKRYGCHRQLLVAKILETRSTELDLAKVRLTGVPMLQNENGEPEPPNAHPLQPILFEFLDNDAPVPDEHLPRPNSEFAQLVQLFGELIRLDVFSHDLYMRTLISRGDLPQLTWSSPHAHAGNGPSVSGPGVSDYPLGGFGLTATSTVGSGSGSSATGVNGSLGCLDAKRPKLELPDFTDSREVDEPSTKVDINKLLASINDEGGSQDVVNGNASDRPFSSAISRYHPDAASSSLIGGQRGSYSRHYYNVLHFPLPQDDNFRHESNQRQMMLYGFGSAKDAKKHVIKRILKDLNKMWSKKNCNDATDSSGTKLRKARSEIHTECYSKFRNLYLHDQWLVAENCAKTCLEQIEEVISGNSTYLPTVENLDFVLSLFEICIDIAGIIEFAEEVMDILVSLEERLVEMRSPLAGSYSFNLALCFACVMCRYHAYVVLNQTEVNSIFEGLFNLLSKHLPPVSAVNSTQKCLGSFLVDLHGSCSYIAKHLEDTCLDVRSIIREPFYFLPSPTVKPSVLKCSAYDPKFMENYIANPRLKLEPGIVENLQNNETLRYNLVTNVFLEVLKKNSETERLQELGILCADLTNHCPALCSDWLGALKAITSSPPADQGDPEDTGFGDLISRIDKSHLGDADICRQITYFCCLLVARGTVPLDNFLFCPLPAVMKTYMSLTSVASAANGDAFASGGGTGNGASGRPTLPIEEIGVHRLMLHLFATFLCVPQRPAFAVPDTSLLPSAKFTNDLYLLSTFHRMVQMYPIFQILKAILIFGDRLADTDYKDPSAELSIGEIIGTVNSSVSEPMQSISELSFQYLADICQQEWIRAKFAMCEPSVVFSEKFLKDTIMTSQQASKLLSYLNGKEETTTLVPVDPLSSSQGPGSQASYVDSPASSTGQNSSGSNSGAMIVSSSLRTQKEFVLKLLRNLDLWNLERSSLLQLQLLITQQDSGSTEHWKVVEMIAKACLEIFQDRSRQSGTGIVNSQTWEQTMGGVWLIAPLMAQLPSPVQARVLKEAAYVLEKRERNGTVQRSAWLLTEQSFLCVVLTCLRAQKDQRDALLNSLLKQLQEYVAIARQDQCELYSREINQELRESLQLRLSLVGGMIDTVCKSATMEQWAVLLTQLITSGVVLAAKDRNLYYTCLDMLGTIIHRLLVAKGEAVEEGRESEVDKQYNALCKKLKKEIGDNKSTNSPLRELHQLLPIPRSYIEVNKYEPYGTPRRGKQPASSASPARNDVTTRRGYQVAGYERVSPWDIIEGRPGGFMLSWFHAIKVDSGPERIETQLARLAPHQHWRHPSIHYDTYPGEVDEELAESSGATKPEPGPSSGVGSNPAGAGSSNRQLPLKKNYYLEPIEVPPDENQPEPSTSGGLGGSVMGGSGGGDAMEVVEIKQENSMSGQFNMPQQHQQQQSTMQRDSMNMAQSQSEAHQLQMQQQKQQQMMDMQQRSALQQEMQQQQQLHQHQQQQQQQMGGNNSDVGSHNNSGAMLTGGGHFVPGIGMMAGGVGGGPSVSLSQMQQQQLSQQQQSGVGQMQMHQMAGQGGIMHGGMGGSDNGNIAQMQHQMGGGQGMVGGMMGGPGGGGPTMGPSMLQQHLAGSISVHPSQQQGAPGGPHQQHIPGGGSGGLGAHQMQQQSQPNSQGSMMAGMSGGVPSAAQMGGMVGAGGPGVMMGGPHQMHHGGSSGMISPDLIMNPMVGAMNPHQSQQQQPPGPGGFEGAISPRGRGGRGRAKNPGARGGRKSSGRSGATTPGSVVPASLSRTNYPSAGPQQSSGPVGGNADYGIPPGGLNAGQGQQQNQMTGCYPAGSQMHGSAGGGGISATDAAGSNVGWGNGPVGAGGGNIDQQQLRLSDNMSQAGVGGGSGQQSGNQTGSGGFGQGATGQRGYPQASQPGSGQQPQMGANEALRNFLQNKTDPKQLQQQQQQQMQQNSSNNMGSGGGMGMYDSSSGLVAQSGDMNQQAQNQLPLQIMEQNRQQLFNESMAVQGRKPSIYQQGANGNKMAGSYGISSSMAGGAGGNQYNQQMMDDSGQYGTQVQGSAQQQQMATQQRMRMLQLHQQQQQQQNPQGSYSQFSGQSQLPQSQPGGGINKQSLTPQQQQQQQQQLAQMLMQQKQMQQQSGSQQSVQGMGVPAPPNYQQVQRMGPQFNAGGGSQNQMQQQQQNLPPGGFYQQK